VTVERITSGVPGLDAVLNGGLPKGALFFVGGPPGSGKTLLSEQIAFHQAAQGSACLIVTALSEPHEKLIRHAQDFTWFDWSRVGREIEFLSLYQPVQEQGLSGALDLLVRTVRQRNAAVVIFDGFRGLRDFGGDELDVRRFIFELGGKLGLLGTTTLLIGEYARNEIDRYPEFTIADGILMLQNDLVGVRHERWLEVVKVRGTDYLGGRHRFAIGTDGIVVFPRLAALVTDGNYELGAGRQPIGVAGLDAMIGGGLRECTVSLLLGTRARARQSFPCNTWPRPPDTASAACWLHSTKARSICGIRLRHSAWWSRRYSTAAPSRSCTSRRSSSTSTGWRPASAMRWPKAGSGGLPSIA